MLHAQIRFALMLTTAAWMIACTTPESRDSGVANAASTPSPAAAISRRAESTPPAHRTSLSAYLPTVLGEVKIVAVGDVMMHTDVVQASQNQTNGFEGLWAEVSPLFQGAEITFGNLETPVAPDSGKKARPFMFNAPANLPAALKARPHCSIIFRIKNLSPCPSSENA